jgi:hypothetical protein
MNKTIIDKNFKSIVSVDPIQEIEKIVGMHYSEFDDDQTGLMLAHAFHTNTMKNEYLKGLGDTHFGMKWDEFLGIIKGYGFIEALQYEFDNENNKEKAIIYYHPSKGLVIWATSYWNGKSVNGGSLYGQVKYTKPIEFEERKWSYAWGSGSNMEMVMTDELMAASRSLNGCSHGAFCDIGDGISFSYDVREALINKMHHIEQHLEFCNPWVTDQFLWFVDFVEDDQPGYDYKKITQEKIERCPVEFQNVVKVYNIKPIS